MDDILITLASNASLNFFPSNSPANYRTKLRRKILLDDPANYVLAIIDIMLPSHFLTLQTPSRIWMALTEPAQPDNPNNDFVIKTLDTAQSIAESTLNQFRINLISLAPVDLANSKQVNSQYVEYDIPRNKISSIEAFGYVLERFFEEKVKKVAGSDTELKFHYDPYRRISKITVSNIKHQLTIGSDNLEIFDWLGIDSNMSQINIMQHEEKYLILMYIKEATSDIMAIAPDIDKRILIADEDNTPARQILNFSADDMKASLKEWCPQINNPLIVIRTIRIPANTLLSDPIKSLSLLIQKFYTRLHKDAPKTRPHNNCNPDLPKTAVNWKERNDFQIYMEKNKNNEIFLRGPNRIGIWTDSIHMDDPVAIALGFKKPRDITGKIITGKSVGVGQTNPGFEMMLDTPLMLKQRSATNLPLLMQNKLFYITLSKTANENEVAVTSSKDPQWPMGGPIYVYSDVVKHQLVGDTEVPLLGVFPADVAAAAQMGINPLAMRRPAALLSSLGSSAERTVYWAFNPPFYLPVSKKEIDEIEIQLNNGSGEPIKLLTGTTVIRVNLRRIFPLHAYHNA